MLLRRSHPHLHREFVLLFVCKHPPLERGQNLNALRLLPHRYVSIHQLKQPRDSFVLLTQHILKHNARAIDGCPDGHQRIGIRIIKTPRVFLRRGKRLQQPRCPCGITRFQRSVRIQQRDAPFVRRQLVRASQELQRFAFGATRRRQLPRTQIRARRQRILPQLLGRFRQS